MQIYTSYHRSTGTTATAMDIDHGGHHAPPSPPVPPLSPVISMIAGSLALSLTDASSLGGIGGGSTGGGTRAGDAPSREKPRQQASNSNQRQGCT